jgi:hypothetical protein
MPQSFTIFFKLFGGFLIANTVAAAIVAWWPACAESLSRHFLGWRALVAVGLLVVAWTTLPVEWRPFFLFLSFCVALVVIPLVLGVLLFPAEMRGGKELHPRRDAPAHSTLPNRLRKPWSSLAEECPPAGIDMARCALLAYETPGKWRKVVPGLGFDDHVAVVQGCAKAIVMIVDNEAVVAFQGTDDAGDWLINLDKETAAPPDDPVHRGFLRAYRSVADQVHDALADHGIRHVWVTGHSLGGAMSVLCAIELVRDGKVDVRGVITFGQPLLLAPSFALKANRLLAGRHMRFIHEDDLVTRIVPGFRGGGSSIWFKDGKPIFNVPRMLTAAVEGNPFAPMELDIEDGPSPLTDEGFEAEKGRIRAVRAEAPEPRPGEPVVAQTLPTAKDHPMTLYLEAVERSFGSADVPLVAPATSTERQ